MKKIQKLLIVCLLLFSGGKILKAQEIIASGYCGAEGTDGDNIYWSLNDNYDLTISGYGAMADYSLSINMQNFTIYSTAPWYQYAASLKSLTFEGDITYIGEYAFYACKFSSTLTLPNTVTNIGASAFYLCGRLSGSLIIPEGVTTIGDNAFGFCEDFTGDLIIPNSVTSLGKGAFSWCLGLDGTLTLSENITEIGKSTFHYCSGLTGSLNIPEGVTTIGETAFYCCENLTGSLNIPASVTSIGREAFSNCHKLSGSLHLPKSLNNIGNQAFKYCNFSDVYSLAETAPELGNNVFSCAHATLHYTATSTGYDENGWEYFENRDNVVAGGKCGDNLYWSLNDNYDLRIYGYGAMYDYSLSINMQNFRIYSTAPWYQYAASLKSLTFEGDITYIGEYAFYACKFSSTLTLPNTVTNIGASAFYLCGRLSGSLIIPEGVTTIGDNAFGFCEDFTGDLIIPNSVTSLGKGAFSWCLGLDGTLTLSENITEIGKSTFHYCSGLTGSLNIPEGVTTIGETAFYCCENLTGSLNIPASVTSIGREAFNYCDNFTDVYSLAETAPELGDNVFSCADATLHYTATATGYDENGWEYFEKRVIASGQCGDNIYWSLSDNYDLTISGYGAMYDYSLSINMQNFTIYSTAPWYQYAASLKSLTFEGDITYIGEYAFYACKFSNTLTLPNTVTNIGASAFYLCGRLSGSLIIPEGVTTIGDNAFGFCEDFTGDLIIPNSVTSLGKGAFTWCLGLDGTLTLSENITEIGKSTFHYCLGLTGSLNIPEGVTTIGETAFYCCENLTGSLNIPASVTSIGREAFNYCDNFTDVYSLAETAPELGDNVFSCADATLHYTDTATGYDENGWEYFEKRDNNTDTGDHEDYYPIVAVAAEVNEENNVDVTWSWSPIIPKMIVVDFESGSINQANFDNNGNAPWEITNDAYEGNYAIKSTCEGLDNGKSEITITLDVPFDGIMSFYHKVSCEQFFDNGYFYIDGVQKAVATGTADWSYREYKVKKGTHTYKWSYQKDIADSAGDDAYYVDNIVLYQEIPPFEGGWIHYDEGEYANAVGSQTGAIYWGISFPDTEEYAGYSLTKVSYFDQDPFNITANIYLGGTEGPETLVSSQNFTTTGSKSVIEVELDNPVLLDGTQPLWITFYSTGDFPATGCYHVGDSNSDWISFNGTTWGHTVDYGVIYSWLVRGYLENVNGEKATLAKAEFKGETSTGPAIAKADAKPFEIGVPERNTNKSVFQNIYNVYRKNILTGEKVTLAQNVSDTTLVDTQWSELEDGAYKWGVGAIYADNKGESEITWSNTLDMGEMFTKVLVQVNTNGSNNAEGAKIKFNNIEEPGMGYDYKGVMNESGECNFDSFRKGNYSYVLTMKGYDTIYVDYVQIWDETNLVIDLEEVIAPVENLFVSATGWAMWENKNFSNGGGEFAFDFDNGTIDGWQTIDADGDGFNWRITTDILGPGNGHNGSRYCVVSQSFDNELDSPLTPDNYFVTTEKYLIKDGSQLSFYVCAQDATWSAEHYGIAISTTGNSNPEDFTMIWEETLSAKSGDGIRNDAKQGAWYLKRIDLSKFAEQEIYIAFRHFNCTDQFYVNIDDIVLVNESKNAKSVVSYDVYLDDVLEATVTTPYYQHDIESEEFWNAGPFHVTKVVANYVSGSSEAVEYGWMANTCDSYNGANEFTAEYFDGKAVLNWYLPGQEIPEISDSFFFDFEDETLNGWNTIDADGDLITWMSSANYMEPGNGNNGSQHYALSESFSAQYTQILTPDNYLVTSEKYAIKEGSKLTFFVCAQDPSFAAEHYGIAISLAGNSDPSDFTMIWEETLSAKGERGTRGDRQTEWTKKCVDLSEFAGRDIYIAFRHFNCTDQYMLNIDDITLTTNNKGRETGIFRPLGVMVFRDGELLTPEPIMANSFTEVFPDKETHEYCIRVVYEHYPDPETEVPGDVYSHFAMSCPQCEDVEYVMPCNAPQNFAAEAVYYSGNYGVKLTWANNHTADHYNIYRSTDDANYEMIAEVSVKTYTEEIDVNGTYYYQVTAVYVEGDEECESSPVSASVLVPVSVDENMLNDMKVYPNPTRGTLNIKAEGITRITISNTLGQVIYDSNVNSNDETVDMSQYEAGIYMVRVMTDNGVSTRRITVVK